MVGLRKKLLVGVVAALAVTTAGCTSSSAASGGSGGQGPSQSHLQQVLSSHKIRIGVQTEAAPWGVRESNGSYQGFDIDIAKALGKSLGAQVQFVPETNESRIPSILADKVDVVIASFTAEDDRAQQVEFTIPYAAGGTLIAVPKNSPIHSYADLAGKSISASRGSIGEGILQSEFPKAKPALYNSFADSVQALKSGKVDGLIENNVIVPDLVHKDPNLRVLSGPVLNPSLMAFGIQQGDEIWQQYLDNFIRNYNIDGENEAASQKWLNQPEPDFLK